MTPQPESFQILLQQTETLTSEEKLRLIAYLADSLCKIQAERAPRRYKWNDIQGIFQPPKSGEDAQEWITRSRREADEQRERALEFGDDREPV